MDGSDHVVTTAEPDHHPANIIQVTEAGQLDERMDELHPLYHDCFKNHPYYEDFSSPDDRDKVFDIFIALMSNGLVFFATNNRDQLIGFGGGHPLNHEHEICAAVRFPSSIQPAKTFYQAEVGVRDDYRRHGVGRALVMARLERLDPEKYDGVIMRTQEHNLVSQGLYRSLAFDVMPGISQEVINKRKDPNNPDGPPIVYSDTRIFMYKTLIPSTAHLVA